MTQKDSSNKISRELSKLSNLMETSLFYIRANTLEKDYHVREIYLFKIIHEVLLKEKAAIQEKRIEIEIIHDNVDVSVYTDKKWIEFILYQTLLNSIKYVKPLGKISFKIIKEVGIIKLIMEDNGCGISSSDLPRVFEKGFTGSNKRRGEATGIGLYLCKKSADKMRIDLSIESRENEYTRVIIGFPVGDYYKLK
ncbi:sensor histidine kinase [Haloimpatiens massiliensis]|uniref:sensor histidine kinase n=1 Tax=Haloimpatiens massiliensis TaxID=1658110 RepID=UPI001A9A6256|nr:ATP-binding protein [Haloimpatiens massiliensis]